MFQGHIANQNYTVSSGSATGFYIFKSTENLLYGRSTSSFTRMHKMKNDEVLYSTITSEVSTRVNKVRHDLQYVIYSKAICIKICKTSDQPRLVLKNF